MKSKNTGEKHLIEIVDSSNLSLSPIAQMVGDGFLSYLRLDDCMQFISSGLDVTNARDTVDISTELRDSLFDGYPDDYDVGPNQTVLRNDVNLVLCLDPEILSGVREIYGGASDSVEVYSLIGYTGSDLGKNLSEQLGKTDVAPYEKTVDVMGNMMPLVILKYVRESLPDRISYLR